MTTGTLTLTGFLLARIEEEEQAARTATDYLGRPTRLPWHECLSPLPWELAHVAHRYDPARVLAECEAKRRIVEDLVRPYIAERRRLMNGQPSWSDEHPDILRLLALPYADHPDYDESWRP